MTVGQNRKLGNKKTRNNISEISEMSEVSEFSNCHFFIFHFSIFYSRQFGTLYLCYVLFSKPFEVFFPSAKNCNIFCCSKSYLNLLVFVSVHFLAFLNLELQSATKFEVNKISEISEFSILPHTQNRKLGNLGNFSFTSIFDSCCKLRCKNNKKLTLYGPGF